MGIQKIMAMVKRPVQAEVVAGGEMDAFRDTRSPIRLGIMVLVIGFGGFLLWAAFAPLDEGVPCQGAVSIATKSKVIESLYGGAISEVYVQEGDMVRRGDKLISFDKTAAKARYDEVHQRYLGMRATEGRLLAEMRVRMPSVSTLICYGSLIGIWRNAIWRTSATFLPLGRQR